MRTLLRKIKFRKFEKVFGFVPSEGRIQAAEQGVVDERLRELAEEFDSLCKRQESHRAGTRPGGHKWGELYEVQFYEVRGEVSTLYLNLQAAKQAFWHAHKIAKKAGFSVKEKYGNYLPEPLL